jgi:hypothetical protein
MDSDSEPNIYQQAILQRMIPGLIVKFTDRIFWQSSVAQAYYLKYNILSTFGLFFSEFNIRMMSSVDRMFQAVENFCEDIKQNIYQYGARLTGQQINNSFVAPNWQNYFPPEGVDNNSDLYRAFIDIVFMGTGTIPPNTDIDTIINNLKHTMRTFLKEFYNKDYTGVKNLISKYPHNAFLQFIQFLRDRITFAEWAEKNPGQDADRKERDAAHLRSVGLGGGRRKSIRKKRRRSHSRSKQF